MSVKNAYRQGYRAADIGDIDNPYKSMNKQKDSYAWERGFNDCKNGFAYQPPGFSCDNLSSVFGTKEYEAKIAIYPWMK